MKAFIPRTSAPCAIPLLCTRTIVFHQEYIVRTNSITSCVPRNVHIIRRIHSHSKAYIRSTSTPCAIPLLCTQAIVFHQECVGRTSSITVCPSYKIHIVKRVHHNSYSLFGRTPTPRCIPLFSHRISI